MADCGNHLPVQRFDILRRHCIWLCQVIYNFTYQNWSILPCFQFNWFSQNRVGHIIFNILDAIVQCVLKKSPLEITLLLLNVCYHSSGCDRNFAGYAETQAICNALFDVCKRPFLK